MEEQAWKIMVTITCGKVFFEHHFQPFGKKMMLKNYSSTGDPYRKFPGLEE